MKTHEPGVIGGSARRINKKRAKAGRKSLDTGKRDNDQIILSVLECIHEQCVQGTLERDIMFRCELNYHYGKQVIEYLLQNQLIQQWQTMDDPDDENSNFHSRCFLTQKGSEIYERLKQELGAIGFVPKLNPQRV